MIRKLPDLWNGCYEGEHRKLLSPEQFKQMFCDVCMNQGCTNSKGADSKWSKRMMNQEDLLLKNPRFAPESTAEVLGIPDFKDMLHEALRIEVSSKKSDWEPVSELEMAKEAAEIFGFQAPLGFSAGTGGGEETQKREKIEDRVEVKAPETNSDEGSPKEMKGKWKVRGDSVDANGNRRSYAVVLYADDSWGCECPSREPQCKHIRHVMGMMGGEKPEEKAPETKKPEDPIVPAEAPRAHPAPRFMNTHQPTGGLMVGPEIPGQEIQTRPQTETRDPWEAPQGPAIRKLGVGGKVVFGNKG